MSADRKLKGWISIILITIFSISFLTIRGETNKINDEIISLKIRKKIIKDNKINLLSKRNKLMSQTRIERIARDSLRMKKQEINSKDLTLNVK